MTILEQKIRNIVNNSSDPMFNKLNCNNKNSICRYFLYILASLQISKLDRLEKDNNIRTIANYKMNNSQKKERFLDIILNSINL